MYAKNPIRLSKEHFVLLLLVILNIVVRLPIVPHEIGSDSFVYHDMVNQILEERKSDWTFYLWELFAQDASSLPITSSMNLAILSLYTGLEIEVLVLFFSIFLGVLGVCASYLMSFELFGDKRLSMLTAFIFSFSPSYISVSLFTISTRGLLLAVLPLLIWAFLRFNNTHNFLYLFLGFFVFVLLIPIHHSFVLAYSIIGALIASYLYFRIKDFVHQRLTRKLHVNVLVLSFLFFIFLFVGIVFFVNSRLRILSFNLLLLFFIFSVFFMAYAIRINFYRVFQKSRLVLDYLHLVLPFLLVSFLVAVIFVQLFSGIAFFEKLKFGYKHGKFFSGESAQIIFLNMGIDYGSSEGILLPFALVGFFVMLMDVGKMRNYLFFLLIFLACSVLLIHGEYMTIFLIPIFSVFICLGLIHVMAVLKRRSRLIAISFICSLTLSILFSLYMANHWTFQLDRAQGTHWMQERTLHSALFLKREKNPITYNDAILARMTNSIIFPNNVGWIHEIMPYRYESKEAMAVISRNNISHVVVNKNIPYEATGANQLYSAPFIRDIQNKENNIYDNSLQDIWTIENR